MTYTAKIYKITCSCCKKIYVGSCRNKKGLPNRMSNHRCDCNRGKNSKLYNHMREVGFDKFTILLIEVVEIEDIDEQRKLENDKIEQLDTINNGLNTNRAYRSKECSKQQKSISDSKYRSKQINKDKHNIYKQQYRANHIPYVCLCCDYSTNRIDTYKRHCNSLLHIKKFIQS